MFRANYPIRQGATYPILCAVNANILEHILAEFSIEVGGFSVDLGVLKNHYMPHPDTHPKGLELWTASTRNLGEPQVPD